MGGVSRLIFVVAWVAGGSTGIVYLCTRGGQLCYPTFNKL